MRNRITNRFKAFGRGTRVIVRDVAKPETGFTYVKAFPIFISVLALVISFLSWNDSHRGRLINEEANRPVLTLASIQPSLDTLTNDEGERISLKVKLKNSGKVTSTVSSLSVLPYLMHSSGSCQLEFAGIGKEGIAWTQESIDIAPGEEQGVLRQFIVSRTCKVLRFQIDVAIRYVDTNGREFGQHFDVPLDISIPELRKQYAETFADPKPPPEVSPTRQ
jgi:hypothetical protein